MSALTFQRRESRARVGLKGPRAAEWLSAPGIVLPPAPNTWTESYLAGPAGGGPLGGSSAGAALLVARLGASEFFLEDGFAPAAAGVRAAGAAARGVALALQTPPPGVYPVLREDVAFLLSGEGALAVLAQICNVNFAALELDARPLIMTLMIGVSVLVVPQNVDGEVQYRIWCDPTFGSYLDEWVGKVVIDCGGSHAGVSV